MRLDSSCTHCIFSPFNYFINRHNIFLHITIDIFHFTNNAARAVFSIQTIHHMQQQFFTIFQLLPVMIAQNHFQLNFIRTAIDTQTVIKPFIQLSIFRTLAGRQQHLPLGCHRHSVAHLIFSRTRMYRNSIKCHRGIAGIKGFIIQFTNSAAVNCVGKISTKICQRKMLRSPSYFFVRGKRQKYLAMLDFRMCK